jgi:hypothetical protein
MTLMSTVHWDVVPCNLLQVYLCFEETYCLHLHGRRVSRASKQSKNVLVACTAYSSTPKLEAVRSSETSVNFYLTIRCHIPEGILQLEQCRVVCVILRKYISRYSDGLWTGRPGQDFSLRHSVQTDSRANPASYPMGTGGSFPWGKTAGEWSWPLTSI